ncbi:MAG: hypothetical protein QNJ46_25140 [Leptolyngbyaceae cyanobacterium MO_188.B28]|nr:hypothetical protein [Leptolyngbyaceae cyanobacterium MO_188.B28]
MTDKGAILDVLLAEYNTLKSEQAARIGFRDNLLYVTLGVFGATVSFAVSDPNHTYAFLVIPWVSIILGWTYLVNDQKISALGQYIRHTLVERVKEQTGYANVEAIFGWEIAHRSDPRRKRRKIEQLIIDEITFVGSGAIAILAFLFLQPQPLIAVNILCVAELLLLLILGYEMVIYADLAKGR